MKHLPSVAVDPSAATGARRGDGGRRPLTDTRELTRAAVRCHADMAKKCAAENDWSGVRINAQVIVGMLDKEGV